MNTEPHFITKFPPILIVIIANLIPVVGVLYWGWNLSVILVLYWLESLVIGVMNIFNILVANGSGGARGRTALFFIVHYGMFWFVHGLFLFVFLVPRIIEFSGAENAGIIQSAQTIKYAFWGFALSHLVSTIMNFLSHPVEDRLPPTLQMFTPYGRVFVMHIVILGGAGLAARYANITSVVLLFVGLKIVFELGSLAVGTVWRKQIKSGDAL